MLSPSRPRFRAKGPGKPIITHHNNSCVYDPAAAPRLTQASSSARLGGLNVQPPSRSWLCHDQAVDRGEALGCPEMGLTVGKVVLEAVVFASSFGITLAILNYSSSPPSPDSAKRAGCTTGAVWNEALYLAVNADVAAAVARKEFKFRPRTLRGRRAGRAPPGRFRSERLE